MASTYPDVPIVANQSQGRLLRTLTGLGPRFLVGVPPNADNWRRERVYEAPINDHLFDRMRASASVAECSGIPIGPPLPAFLPGVLTITAQNRERWLTMTEVVPAALLPLSAHEEERLLDIASLARVAISEPNRGVAMSFPPTGLNEREDAANVYEGPIVPLAMMFDSETMAADDPSIASIGRFIQRNTLGRLATMVRSGRIMLAGITSWVYGIPPPGQDPPDAPGPWPDVAPGIDAHGYYYRLWVWSARAYIPRSEGTIPFALRVDSLLQHLRARQFYPTTIRVVHENVVEGRDISIPWKLAYDKTFYDLLVEQ